MTKFFKPPYQLTKVTLVVFCILVVFLAILAIYISVQNSSISQESPDINKKVSSERGLFMVGEYRPHQESIPSGCKPLLLYINTDDFSIKRINIDKSANLNFRGIHEVRPFIIDNEYKIALATYLPGEVVILSSSNMFWDDLTVEFEEELDERVRAVSVGDIDNDGEKEVVVGTRPDGILKYYQFTNGKWLGTVIDKIGITIHDLLIMDSDGNGINEIIITTSMVRGSVIEKLGSIVLPPEIPEILKYEFAENEWDKEVIWKAETLVVEEKKYAHARYIFGKDFDGDGLKEIAASVSGGVSGLDSLIKLQWNGSGYSQYSQDIMSDGLKISKVIVTSGDINNDGKSEIIAPTIAGDALLLYEWKGNKWERSILTRALIDENGDKNEKIISMAILNSSAKGYKKIFYATSSNNPETAGYTNFYVLKYDALKGMWNRKYVGGLNFSIDAYWGIFPAFP